MIRMKNTCTLLSNIVKLVTDYECISRSSCSRVVRPLFNSQTCKLKRKLPSILMSKQEGSGKGIKSSSGFLVLVPWTLPLTFWSFLNYKLWPRS